jgi:predicted transcriptional regulator
LQQEIEESVMKVKELMVREARSCRVEDNLNRAAQLMWEGDCGVLPVVEADGIVVGMITDRDICMAAYTKGGSLASLRVGDAMAKQVSSCSHETTLETAMSLMKETSVRRLPVLDAQGKLAGILSLNDLAREARKQAKSGGRDIKSVDVADTLGVICEHRQPVAAVAKPQGKRAGELIGAGY